MLSRLCWKSCRLGFTSIWTENFKMYNLAFKEAEKPDINCQHSLDYGESKGISEKKNIYMSSSLFMLKYLTLWITTNCEKFLKKCEYDTNLPVSWETYMQVKKQQLELNMEWWTGFKLQKKYDKTVYSHPAYLASIHSTSWKITGWWITNWNQVCREKY